MTEYKLYPQIPSAPPEAPPQVGYHLNVIQAKRQGLIAKEKMFKKKSKKNHRILNRLTWLNAKVARPLRTKQERDVAEMIVDIYKVGPLTYPSTFQCDNGSEIKGEVTKMLEKQEVKIWQVTTKYKHTHTAFVEDQIKILAERLFKVQDAQELNDPEKVSSRCVKHLYGLVDELNDTTTEMIGMKPKDAMKLNEVLLVIEESYPPEEVLPEDGLYWYLLLPGEEHDDQRCRATDRVWSKGTYRLREIIENPGNRMMYYLRDGPE